MNRELDRGEVQDRLPDYVLGTLPADERLAVERAVAADSELARELAAVRAVRAALAVRARPVNVDAIVAAVQRPAARRAGGVRRWRIAAAIATIAIGGAALAVVQRALRDGASPSAISGETTLVATGGAGELSFGYDLSGLNQQDLDQLIADLQKSGGLPSAEPRSSVVMPTVQGGKQQ